MLDSVKDILYNSFMAEKTTGMIQLGNEVLSEIREQAEREERTMRVVLERAWRLYRMGNGDGDQPKCDAKVPKR